VCYRRHGHNEGDEPSFTQPVMYRKIKERPRLAEVYTEQLVLRGDLTAAEAEAITQQFEAKLQAALEEAKTGPPQRRGMRGFAGHWKGLTAEYSFTPLETGVPYDTLRFITERITTVPEQFEVNAKLKRQLEARRKDMAERKPVDWSLGEALAFGSLLLEGTPVRLSGQDSRRGTFSQRHSVLFDVRTGEPYCALRHLRPGQAAFQTIDSPLSEAAVLGFEFGYSLDSPQSLVLWEAQFGDFVNGAQVIIDQFLVCSESKWQRASGVVLLLPHAYEGQGAEHSSGRLERFLQMCAEDNIQVCNATTPVQYFHLLRRQQKREFRKPLVLMTPKSLLRQKQAFSPVDEFTTGGFRELLDDPRADPSRVRRVLLCSGKIYYDLLERRAEDESGAIAIVRLEQLYPFPEDALEETLSRYRKAREWVWVQEESMNMGAWSFIEPRLRALGREVQYVGRDASASPATGSRTVHLREQRELVEAAIHGEAPHLVRATAVDGRARRLDPVEQTQAEAS
jgi:2-oxoglutarate dehydrogenase E1 component